MMGLRAPQEFQILNTCGCSVRPPSTINLDMSLWLGLNCKGSSVRLSEYVKFSFVREYSMTTEATIEISSQQLTITL